MTDVDNPSDVGAKVDVHYLLAQHCPMPAMMFLPPFISRKTHKRTHKCVRCDKLTNPALASCEHCGYTFTDADRNAMEACREERSQGAFGGLLIPLVFVLIVVVVLLTL